VPHRAREGPRSSPRSLPSKTARRSCTPVHRLVDLELAAGEPGEQAEHVGDALTLSVAVHQLCDGDGAGIDDGIEGAVWAYEVGMPAKSGLSGCIIAVIPGQIGISVYSPPIDGQGNSVRGIRVCQEISNAFELHAFNNRTNVRSVIRRD
jgi:Glutaminase